MAERDRVRLTQLLRLLASEHVGERAAAGAAADRHLRALGMNWDDLVQRGLGAAEARPHAPDRWRQPRSRPFDTDQGHVAWLTARCRFLSSWEVHFVQEIGGRLREGRPLTTRQGEKLREIAWRVEQRASAEFAS